MTAKRKGPIGRLPTELHNSVVRFAKNNGYSINAVIIMALRQFLISRL